MKHLLLLPLICLLCFSHFQLTDQAIVQSMPKSLHKAASHPITNGIKLDIIKISEFSLIQGKHAWIQNSKNALLNTTTIHFDASFGCIMYIGGNTLKGKYWIDEDVIKIFVEFSHFSGGQGTTIEVTGAFQAQQDKSAPGIGAIHFLSTGKYYSKINGTEFRNTVAKEYTCSFEYVTSKY